jgi:tocopherol O-methyltransferase
MSPENDRNVSQQLEKKVEKYYDDNTKMFLKLGGSGSSQVIHQPLYLRGQDSREQALHAQHHLLLDMIASVSGDSVSILDLGCGVGSSMFYMSEHTKPEVHFCGITVSGKQYVRGLQLVSQRGMSGKVRLIQGSFQELPPDIGRFDLVYGIESFLHSPDATKFIDQVRSVLKPGGVFVLFDDFLARSVTTHKDKRTLMDLQLHYKALSLFRPEILDSLVRRHGFEEYGMTDFTSALRPSRLKNMLIHLAVPLARLFSRQSSYCTFLIGGDARQRALRTGLLKYCMLRWRRS